MSDGCGLSADHDLYLNLIPAETDIAKEAVYGTDKGGLQGCASTYTTKKDMKVWRAYNSENPYSKSGKWWTAHDIEGSISGYRQKYEICPSYSPLDRMEECSLPAGSTIVVGSGQSAKCNEYFKFASDKELQIYMPDATVDSLAGCKTYKAFFDWKIDTPASS